MVRSTFKIQVLLTCLQSDYQWGFDSEQDWLGSSLDLGPLVIGERDFQLLLGFQDLVVHEE